VGLLPKENLSTPQRPIVWSVAQLFEGINYVAVVVKEVSSQKSFSLAPAPSTIPVPELQKHVVISMDYTKPIVQTSGLCNLDLHTLYPYNIIIINK
jgi:hypothetical protein